jgi:hypothetical protein
MRLEPRLIQIALNFEQPPHPLDLLGHPPLLLLHLINVGPLDVLTCDAADIVGGAERLSADQAFHCGFVLRFERLPFEFVQGMPEVLGLGVPEVVDCLFQVR